MNALRRFAILCHRWMGVAFCLLFTWWFASGIVMMYSDYPSVGPRERLAHTKPIDPARVHISPRDAAAKLGQAGTDPGAVQLITFLGRPAYKFPDVPATIYADDGSPVQNSPNLFLRIAADWAGQPESSAHIEDAREVDQWTLGVQQLLPLRKYAFPDGQEIYISESSAEIVQATTRASRIVAEFGAIPHWMYYLPLRTRGTLWRRVIIWASSAATVAALLGLIVGISMYWPSKRVPYTGQKRLHMVVGLFFGIITCTWAFSGMLSMEPFPAGSKSRRPSDRAPIRVMAALQPEPAHLANFASLPPLPNTPVKSIEPMTFNGAPVYVVTDAIGKTHLEPPLDSARIMAIVTRAAAPALVTEQTPLTKYDAWYTDRHGERPLPVLRIGLNDTDHTHIYVDPVTGQVADIHNDHSSFVTRWLYHGLHSMDFPWLYNYRPAWDIVVLALMLGGLTVSVTSVILAWQVLRRKAIAAIGGQSGGARVRGSSLSQTPGAGD